MDIWKKSKIVTSVRGSRKPMKPTKTNETNENQRVTKGILRLKTNFYSSK